MPLIPGVISTTSVSASSVSLTSTAATGGTAPYTYQWFKTLQNAAQYQPIAGATSVTLTDTAVVAGNVYYYVLVSTDATSTSLSSNTLEIETIAAQAATGPASDLRDNQVNDFVTSTQNGKSVMAVSNADGTPIGSSGGGSTSSAFNAIFPANGTASGFIDQNGKMQAASVAAFHAGDNTVVSGSGLGVLTGGVTQIKNAIGNLDRQTEAGLDNISSLGVTTGASQFAVPFTLSIASSIPGINSPQTVTPSSMSHVFVGTVLNFDTGTPQENVVVVSVTATAFTAVFKNSHAANTSGQAFYYNQARDAAIGDKVGIAGLSPSVTYLVNAITGLAEQDRSAAGELDGATGTGTAVAAEYEYNGGGPLTAAGNVSGLAFDRARNLQGKGLIAGVFGATTVAGATSISVSAAPVGLLAGQQVMLDRGTANAESSYVATSYVSGATTILLQSPTAFVHTITTSIVEWDVFATAGPGLNGFSPTGIGIEEEALYNPVDGKYYIERSATQDSMPAANIVAESPALWNGTSFDRLKGTNGAANVSLAAPGRGTTVQAAVSVGVGSTAVTGVATTRQYLCLINDSANTIYVTFGATAALNTGLRLNGNGGSVTYDTFVPQNALSAISATAASNLLVITA